MSIAAVQKQLAASRLGDVELAPYLKPGLGTNIVEALAKRLDAEVSILSKNPGTSVSVAHRQIAAIEDVNLHTA